MNQAVSQISRRAPWKTLIFCVLASTMLVGCGREKIAPVKGIAKHKGAPVTGGTFIFSPIGAKNPGKPASAVVQADGSFALGTNGKSDGALVGKHRVVYTPPQPELTEQQRSDPTYTAPLPPYVGCHPKEAEVEIKPGTNTIEIELMPAS